MGHGDERGAHMLRNIMTTDPNFDLLRMVGVSEDGVDFVSRLLNRDPLCRPSEEECLHHPWIANVADVEPYEQDDFFSPNDDVTGLSDIGEEEDDDDVEHELDASQLSIYDDEEADWVDNDAQVKRRRFDYPPVIPYPSVPDVEEKSDATPSAPEPSGRSFLGKITSAQHSSGIFPSAIDPFKGQGSNIHDFVSSTGESINESNHVYSVISLPEHVVCGSAPSLMGAENLVGQLRMNSPARASRPVLEEPLQILSAGRMKGIRASVGSSDDNENHLVESVGEDAENTPKPDRSNGRRSLPFHEGGESMKGHYHTGAGADFDDELALTIDAHTGREIMEPQQNTDGEEHNDTENDDDNYQHGYDNNNNPGGTKAIQEHYAALQIPATPETITHGQYEKPRQLLGKLTTIPGSIFDLTIELQERMTSWGRGLQASIRYPQPLDTRIPAYALEITFWAPSIEERIASGEDWTKVPGVMTILSTKTSQCIWVNGVELRRGPIDEGNKQKGFYFGKLYTNDIITVYHHKDEFLKFRAEFYHGLSARERPQEEKGFLVRKVLVPQTTGTKKKHQ